MTKFLKPANLAKIKTQIFNINFKNTRFTLINNQRQLIKHQQNILIKIKKKKKIMRRGRNGCVINN